MAVGNAGFAATSAKSSETASPLKMFLSRYFYLLMSLVLSGLVVWGFSQTVSHNLFRATPARPLLLWIHGAAFSTWMLFFIVQSALVRVRRVGVHRLIGWFGAGLAALMVVLGIWVAVVMGRFDVTVLHQSGVQSFLSIPIVDMVVFGTCVGLAIYWRKKPDYHRRLIFIGTCQLMDAAFGRFDVLFNSAMFFPALDALILLGMLRDWIVEGRVHRVYLYALPAMMALQGFAVYTWRVNPPWWAAITHAILGV